MQQLDITRITVSTIPRCKEVNLFVTQTLTYMNSYLAASKQGSHWSFIKPSFNLIRLTKHTIPCPA